MMRLNKTLLGAALLLASFTLSGCNQELAPDVVPVENFEAERYLGQWYEIARIENRFEKGLSNVTANYSVREDGGIKVVNKGYKDKTGKWQTANGKAYFVDGHDKGHLKVSFFGPIYGPYIVFDLGKDYEYSFVTNNDKKFLWLLSRTSEITPELKTQFTTKIEQMNFDTSKLIWVDQTVNSRDQK